MTRTRKEILEERRRLKAEYGRLFDDVTALLFRCDPVGINFEINPDEYEPEAGTILPRLRGCRSADGVMTVVHEEFVRWFSQDVAGPRERYREIANETWKLWQASQGGSSPRDSGRDAREERLISTVANDLTAYLHTIETQGEDESGLKLRSICSGLARLLDALLQKSGRWDRYNWLDAIVPSSAEVRTCRLDICGRAIWGQQKRSQQWSEPVAASVWLNEINEDRLEYELRFGDEEQGLGSSPHSSNWITDKTPSHWLFEFRTSGPAE